jgi:hypothetical protein
VGRGSVNVDVTQFNFSSCCLITLKKKLIIKKGQEPRGRYLFAWGLMFSVALRCGVKFLLWNAQGPRSELIRTVRKSWRR